MAAPGPAILVHLELAVQKHEGATRAHPDSWKMKAKKIFRASRGLIGATPLYALPPAACNIILPPQL